MRKTIIIFFLLLTGCFAPSTKSSKPIVLVTIPTYAYFVQQIAGDTVSTEVFVPPGANPHTYEPTPRQVEKFTMAKIWLRFGDPIEEKILPFLKEKNVKIVDLTDGVPLLEGSSHACEGHTHTEEGKDLHVWLNPRLAAIQVKTIADQLKMTWPENRDLYEQKYQLLISKLKDLDQEIEKQLEPFKGSYLLVSHPALGYYCARYGLNQLSIECEGKDPRPQQVATIVSEAKENKVQVIFTEPQYNNKGAILIAEKLNLPIYQIDPYASDYLNSMREITRAIVKFYAHPS